MRIALIAALSLLAETPVIVLIAALSLAPSLQLRSGAKAKGDKGEQHTY